ncbi:MAG TPA: ABC transporter ATP-binding protein [Usitatibacter sp.]|nr:ABC transporter ATP-binding protein [Usitatibacter sp.]
MAYLQLRSLGKSYGDQWAVRDVSLGVEQGEVLSLLGPSGCGKTTTLNMIAGFIEPTSGSIDLDGKPIDKVPLNRRDTLMVFQSYALFPHMTASQNVAFGLEMRKVPKEERGRRVAEALALVGLGHLGQRYPGELSGGQQQRVALARALVLRPKVLLLDEPLSNLDAKLRQEMRVELRRIQQQVGITTVFVTHDQAEALAISDRIAVMNAGVVEQLGSAVEIYERPASLFVATFIGEINALRATVVGVHEDTVTAKIDDGAVVGAARSREHRVGDEVTLLVRPERLRFASGGSSANRLSGVVDASIYVGNMIQLRLKVAGHEQPLQIHLPGIRGAASHAAGDVVTIEWDPQDSSVIPA